MLIHCARDDVETENFDNVLFITNKRKRIKKVYNVKMSDV